MDSNLQTGLIVLVGTTLIGFMAWVATSVVAMGKEVSVLNHRYNNHTAAEKAIESRLTIFEDDVQEMRVDIAVIKTTIESWETEVREEEKVPKRNHR